MEGVRQGQGILGFQPGEVALLEHQLLLPAPPALPQPGQQPGLAPAPAGGDGLRRARKGDPLEQGRRLGPRAGLGPEANPHLRVEHGEKGNLSLLAVAIHERLAERAERIEPSAAEQTAQDLGAAGQLGNHVRAERQLASLGREVDLEQPRELRLGGQARELACDLPVALRIGPKAAGIEPVELLLDLRQP